jgi:hypothetical protein
MSSVRSLAEASAPSPVGDNSAALTSGAKMPDSVKAALAALGGLAVAVITLLATFGVVTWSSAQTGLATAEAAAVVGFLSACAANFWPGTKREPVAVSGTFTALVAATLALVSGFHVWTLTQDEISALMGLLTAMLAVGAALFVRGQVTAAKPKA